MIAWKHAALCAPALRRPVSEALLERGIASLKLAPVHLPVLRNALDGARAAKRLVADVLQRDVGALGRVPVCGDIVDDVVHVKDLQGMPGLSFFYIVQIGAAAQTLNCMRHKHL